MLLMTALVAFSIVNCAMHMTLVTIQGIVVNWDQ